jgi:hypothetical protein
VLTSVRPPSWTMTPSTRTHLAALCRARDPRPSDREAVQLGHPWGNASSRTLEAAWLQSPARMAPVFDISPVRAAPRVSGKACVSWSRSTNSRQNAHFVKTLGLPRWSFQAWVSGSLPDDGMRQCSGRHSPSNPASVHEAAAINALEGSSFVVQPQGQQAQLHLQFRR